MYSLKDLDKTMGEVVFNTAMGEKKMMIVIMVKMKKMMMMMMTVKKEEGSAADPLNESRMNSG